MSTFKNCGSIKYHEMQTSLQNDHESDSPNQQCCVWSKKHAKNDFLAFDCNLLLDIPTLIRFQSLLEQLKNWDLYFVVAI
jgi:hypothetical protein